MLNTTENTKNDGNKMEESTEETQQEGFLAFQSQLNKESNKRRETEQKKLNIQEGEKHIFMAIKKHILGNGTTVSSNDRQEENIQVSGKPAKKIDISSNLPKVAHVSINLPVDDMKQRNSIFGGSYRRSRGESISKDIRKINVSSTESIVNRRKSQLSRTADSEGSSVDSVEAIAFAQEKQDENSFDDSAEWTKCDNKTSVTAYKVQKKQESIQNIVEREKKRQVERKALISRMRKNLPTYNITQIRELRLPYHEAIFANMEEKSYVSSVAFGKELLNFQDNLRKDSPQGSVAFSKPMLQYDKEKFTLLMESLRKAEDNHRELNLIGECEEFLKLSILFAFADADDWWWLGEQLLIQTIKISSNYSSKIGNKYEALSRYIYGRYLLEKLKEFKNASVQLKISRMLSHGKGWLCKSYFPELRGTLFMQCSHGIYYCTIREVKFYMGNQDYDKAIVLAEQARKRAAEACYKNGETHALVLKGICEMETGHLKSSISSLMRAYSIQNRFGTVEGLCKIRIHLAKAYLMDKCANSSLNVLLELKRDAERYNLPYYLGLAYKNLGQYYLLIGENNKALPLLKQSLKIFKKCDSTTPAFKEIQSTETLKVISGGLQLFPKYVSLLVDVDIFGVVRSDSLKALLLWKENRTPFWSDKDHLITYNSCEDILTESVRRVCESRANFFDKNLKEIAKH
ncbi:uncharacterized protein LOC130900761 [Diorhabda carinulata]|uniref:uncharacterized protein LOC130900761 n=1 Tax=Diorhabda carinulata TaxID=1163345 RepID=UPI0025A2503F|nr:uncharacterized protein LOC130900761 [Diorhabda carinulata]